MKKYPKVGKYKVKNKEKYVANLQECEHRSSWELRYMKYLDNNPDVLEWGSENIRIPYYNPIEQKTRRYIVDFYVKSLSKTGMVKKYIIEIKPHNQCFPPKKPKRKTKNYINECVTYTINEAKWNAANKFCKSRDWDFIILTEDDILV